MQPIARYRPHPLQHRGHAARRGQAADRSAEASTRSPRLAFGAVTNLCDATSALTVEGDLPSSLAISLHDALRSSILWTVSRSCLVWIGNTYLDDSGRDSPASLNSTGDM